MESLPAVGISTLFLHLPKLLSSRPACIAKHFVNAHQKEVLILPSFKTLDVSYPCTSLGLLAELRKSHYTSLNYRWDHRKSSRSSSWWAPIALQNFWMPLWALRELHFQGTAWGSSLLFRAKTLPNIIEAGQHAFAILAFKPILCSHGGAKLSDFLSNVAMRFCSVRRTIISFRTLPIRLSSGLIPWIPRSITSFARRFSTISFFEYSSQFLATDFLDSGRVNFFHLVPILWRRKFLQFLSEPGQIQK